jgi:hypothetical protein
MATAVLLLAAVVAWMLYRRQSEDGTLPDGLTIRGATVSVANVDAVERRKVWQFLGVPRDGSKDAILLGERWQMQEIGRRLEFLPVNGFTIAPMQWVSHRPDRRLLIDRPPSGLWSKDGWNEALNGWDSWWAPKVVSVLEAKTMDVIELPPNLREI